MESKLSAKKSVKRLEKLQAESLQRLKQAEAEAERAALSAQLAREGVKNARAMLNKIEKMLKKERSRVAAKKQAAKKAAIAAAKKTTRKKTTKKKTTKKPEVRLVTQSDR